MKIINAKEIESKLYLAILQIAFVLPDDVLTALNVAFKKEPDALSKRVLSIILENSHIASAEKIPLCQDTGIVVCFVKIGSNVHINGFLNDAINQAVSNAYRDGFLRPSIVEHPLTRINTRTNTPALIYVEYIEGDSFVIDVMLKGGGSENMSVLKMLNPTATLDDIKQHVLETVKNAHGKPCPPIVVGIGIGGSFDYAAVLAKKALFRRLDDENPDSEMAKAEKEIFTAINNLNIGPMGYGGRTTCIGVKIKTSPCHIACLPLAINIQCHSSRHISIKF